MLVTFSGASKANRGSSPEAEKAPDSANQPSMRKLRETPMLLKVPSGIIQQSPWLAIASKQLELMSKFMSELGLSPVSRARVEVKPLGPKAWETTSKFAGLLGGRDQSDDRNDEYFGWTGR
jgi:hypothetical protein